MNKTTLIEEMAKVSKLSKAACKVALDSAITVISKSLKKGEDVVLTGFGTFGVIHRKKREGVNPHNKQKMIIPAKKAPKFKAGKALKELVS
jgi:DNA-binding protein HU-beta